VLYSCIIIRSALPRLRRLIGRDEFSYEDCRVSRYIDRKKPQEEAAISINRQRRRLPARYSRDTRRVAFYGSKIFLKENFKNINKKLKNKKALKKKKKKQRKKFNKNGKYMKAINDKKIKGAIVQIIFYRYLIFMSN